MNSQLLAWADFGTYVATAYAGNPQAEKDTGIWFHNLCAKHDAITVKPFQAARTYNGAARSINGFCLNDTIFISTSPFVLSLPSPTPLPGFSRADQLVGFWLRPKSTPDSDFIDFAKKLAAPFLGSLSTILDEVIAEHANSGIPANRPQHVELALPHVTDKFDYAQKLHAETQNALEQLRSEDIPYSVPHQHAATVRFAGEKPFVHNLHRDTARPTKADTYMAGRVIIQPAMGAGTGFVTNGNDNLIIECPLHATSVHLGLSVPKDAPPEYAPIDLGPRHKATGHPEGRVVFVWETTREAYRPGQMTAAPWQIKLG